MSSGNTGVQRESWGSRLGFILAAAGSAIGLGNIWRFPYVVGVNGGAAFVLVYVLLVLGVGAGVMLVEFSVGRAAKTSPVWAFWKLSGSHTWTLVGWIATIVGGFIILSYYAVIGGWILRYIVYSLTDLIPLAADGKSKEVFLSFIKDSPQVVSFHILFMALTMAIVLGGVGKGIEKACKVMMPLLFVILIVLIVRSLSLEGASKGVEFYLKPDFSKLTPKSILDAMGMGFYSLSLGMGIMITYGSYIPKEDHLPSSIAWIVFTDTFVAFLAGLAIFPAVFAMGIEPAAGSGLSFITLPSVFAHMPFGQAFSTLFFVLLFFAAITSSMSLLEVTVSHCMDDLKWSRKRSVITMGIFITLLGVPSALSLAGSPTIGGQPFLDAMDFFANNLIMPVSAILTCLFVGWFWLDDAKREITNDGTRPFSLMTAWIWAVRVVIPLAIALICYNGLAA